MPSDLHKDLLQRAREQGKSLNDLLINIAQEWQEKQRSGKL
jgi:hypothetical protein